MAQLVNWARYYYKMVLVDKCNPKHFWFMRDKYVAKVLFESIDGHAYAFFYSDPKDRGGWKCWIPMMLFLTDEYNGD